MKAIREPRGARVLRDSRLLVPDGRSKLVRRRVAKAVADRDKARNWRRFGGMRRSLNSPANRRGDVPTIAVKADFGKSGALAMIRAVNGLRPYRAAASLSDLVGVNQSR